MSVCSGVTLVSITDANLTQDATLINSSATAPSVSFAVGGDNTNIYKLLRDAAGFSNPVVTSTTSGSGATQTTTYAITPSRDEIFTKFGASTIGDGVIEQLLKDYGFEPLAQITATNAATLQSVIGDFNAKVKFTYCLYEKMYKTALQNVFTDVTNAEKKKVAIALNIKLSILVAGMDRIRRYFQNKSAALMAASNNNNAITSTTAELSSQLATLTSKDGERALYSRMVEYTEEKNQAHRNLLGLYSVLNLVALGVIFYISRE
jgi:hypothetical protein